MARLLSPSLRGEFGLAFFVATCMSMVATCGLQFWVATSVATYDSAAFATRTIIRHSLALTIGIGAAGIICAPILADHLALGSHEVAWTAAYAATNAVLLLVIAVPNGNRSMGVVAVALTGGAFAFLAGVSILTIANFPSVTALLAAATAGNVTTIAASIPSWVRIHRSRPSSPHSDLSWTRAVHLYLPSGLGELVFLGMLRADLVMLAVLAPLDDVGVYAIASAFAEVLWVIPDAISQITLPLSAEPNRGDTVTQVFRLTVVIMVPLGLVFTVASPVVIPLLFGSPYRAAVPAVPFLILASLCAAIWKVIGGAIVSRGRPSVRLWTAAGGLIVMTSADVVLIPRFGVFGASIAAAAGYAMAAVAMVVAWMHLPGHDFESLWRIRREDLTAMSRLLGVHRRGRG